MTGENEVVDPWQARKDIDRTLRQRHPMFFVNFGVSRRNDPGRAFDLRPTGFEQLTRPSGRQDQEFQSASCGAILPAQLVHEAHRSRHKATRRDA